MEEDYIILIHKYGYEHLGKLVTAAEITDYLSDKGIDVNDNEIASSMHEVIKQTFTTAFRGGDVFYVYSSEAYYRYLEYLELVESRQNTRVANRNAILALAVSIVLALIQIVIQLKQSR